MRTIWDLFLDFVDRHFWTLQRLNAVHALVAILWVFASDTLRDIDKLHKAIAACAVPYRRTR